jgi:hypothetical protein
MFNPEQAPDMDVYVRKMQIKIQDLLGEFKPFLNDLPRLLRVTSGATLERSRKRSLPHLKVGGHLTIPSSKATNYWDVLMRMMHMGEDHEPAALAATIPEHPGKTREYIPQRVQYKVVSRNRISLVEKNWSTYRTTAAESEGAMPFQLAFDEYGKGRLLKFGIDLRKGQTVNDRAAMLASRGETSDVTVDMERASDCTAFNAVGLLFPWEWFEFLNTFRSVGYTGAFGDGWYHKFSSMGNGCTFVIETIIFWAAAVAVGANHPLVYGDDVIIPGEQFPEFERLINFLGFTINGEKSFTEGPFRESCGGDYFDGIRVTPFYFRRQPSCKREWSHLVNGLLALSYPGSQLETLAASLIVEHQLRVVPYNSDDSSGVFISPTSAYSLGLIRETTQDGGRTGSVRGFKAYLTLPSVRRTSGWRSSFLWHCSKLYHEPKRFVTQSTYDPPGLESASDSEDEGTLTSSVVGSRHAVQWRVYVASGPCPFYVYSSEQAVLAAHATVLKAVVRKRRNNRRNTGRKNG